MKRVSEEAGVVDGNSNSEFGKSGEIRRQKKVRALDIVGEKFGCSEEVAMEIQGKESEGTECQVMGVEQSCYVVGGGRVVYPIDVKVSDSEELDRGVEGSENQIVENNIIGVEEFFLVGKVDRILSGTNVCSSSGDTGGQEVGGKQISKVEVLEEAALGIENQILGFKKLGSKIEVARVLRGSEGCGNGDRGEEEIEKDDHERDLGNMGPSTACGNPTQRSESIMMVDHGVGKENSSWDFKVGQLDFDLNLPAMEAEEGGSERGLHEHTQLGPVIAQRVEIIHISSDESEDEGQQDDRDARKKDKEIDEGFADESTESFHIGLTMDLRTTSDGCISMSGGRRYTREEKGKAKLVDSWLSLATNSSHLDLKPEGQGLIKSADSGGIQLNRTKHPEETTQLWGTDNLEFTRERERRSARAPQTLRQREDTNRYREILRRRASQLAVFNTQQDYQESFNKKTQIKSQIKSIEAGKNLENFLGTFSTEMKLIKERNMKHGAQQLIIWQPSKDRDHKILMPPVPSLLDLSMEVLAKNAEAIVSLEHVPDALKHKLIDLLCDFRKMNIHALDLLVQGSPTEIRIKDCSWITEEQFTKIFGSFDAKNLKVLQLDLCGQGVLGDSFGKTLARFPNSLPDLVIISLKGACRLTNIALKELVASAPALQSINLGQCSFLTNTGINILADSLGAILRELYIDNCQRIDAMLIAPAMKKFKHLEVLSVAGIQTVCDEFLTDIITVCGRNIKELDLADCVKLTDISLKVIGNTCTEMSSLNISNLHKLTDWSMQYLANGCQSIQTLKLRQNSFSDEAIAAYLETSGKSLKELSLNNVRKVGPNTALSLAKCSKELLSLDLSWCRKITNEALGMIVDSCLSLKLLKLFGCTQIDNEFLNGHSNSLVQIIGWSMTPVLEHLNMLEPDKALLRYSPLTFSSDSPSSDH